MSPPGCSILLQRWSPGPYRWALACTASAKVSSLTGTGQRVLGGRPKAEGPGDFQTSLCVHQRPEVRSRVYVRQNIGLRACAPCWAGRYGWAIRASVDVPRSHVGLLSRRKSRLTMTVPICLARRTGHICSKGQSESEAHRALVAAGGRRIWLCSAMAWRQASNWGTRFLPCGTSSKPASCRENPSVKPNAFEKRAAISISDAAKKARHWRRMGDESPNESSRTRNERATE